jgi:hypothetical protein
MTTPADRRQSHRFPTPQDRDQATLQVGDDAYTVRMLDQSATGFAVLIEAHPGVYEGEAVWLKADGVWTKARVTRVSLESGGVKLGLLRVVEEGVAVEPKIAFQLWRMPKNYRITLTIALALLLTIPCVLWLRQLRTSGADAADDALDVNTIAQLDAYQSIRKLGPAIFAHPEVVRCLRLSQPQLDRVRVIVLRGQQAMKLARDTGATPEELRHVWRAAQEEARLVLTKAQQAKWDEMLHHVEEGGANP